MLPNVQATKPLRIATAARVTDQKIVIKRVVFKIDVSSQG